MYKSREEALGQHWPVRALAARNEITSGVPSVRRGGARLPGTALGSIRGRNHRAALICALTAGLRACTAVLHLVLIAFFSARVADPRAKLADLRRKATVSGHCLRCSAASICAVAVEPDALGKRRYIPFGKAGVRAMLASGFAFVAGVDTSDKHLVGHGVHL
jgi:hypothetical protein